MTRRDQLASKASKKEDGRGRGRAPGRGRGRGRGKGGRGKRGVEAEHSSGESEKEMEEDECEMGEGDGEPTALEETSKKRKKNQRSDAKTPKPKVPKVPKVPKSSRASTPRSDAEPKNAPKASSCSMPKAEQNPKPTPASSSKPAASKSSRASSSKGEPRSKTKDPKPSASKSRNPSKKAKMSVEEEDEPQTVAAAPGVSESRVSKRRVSKRKNRRMVADNDAPANGSDDFEQKVGQIRDFAAGLDYHNLEFDDLKFYTKEAVTECFDFKYTQLTIYWKTSRCGIKMYKSDGKTCDPYSFTFPSSLGTSLLRMVVAVATGAYMVARSKTGTCMMMYDV